MIKISIECSRCSKNFLQDVTSETLNNDLIRKAGFVHIHDGETNIIICIDCAKKFKDLQEKLKTITQTQLHGFFSGDGEDKANECNCETKIG